MLLECMRYMSESTISLDNNNSDCKKQPFTVHATTKAESDFVTCKNYIKRGDFIDSEHE